MSKSFTPKELYLADMALKNAVRNALFIMHTENGDHIRLDNYLAKERYPELSFLFSDFDNLYKKYEENQKALQFLDSIEARIRELEEGISSAEPTEQDTVSAWFNGNLDKHFYYSEVNTSLFLEYLEEEIQKIEQDSHKKIKCEKNKSENKIERM